MKRKNATRNALFTSIISLMLCVSMLVGTTFAWFTDSVASGSNVIKSGNLDVEVQYTLDGQTWKDLNGANDLFQKGLWEPGHTEVVALKIENKGSLAFKYAANMNIVSEDKGVNVYGEEFYLSDILTVSYMPMDGGPIGAALAGTIFSEDDASIWESSDVKTGSFREAFALAEDNIVLKGTDAYVLIKVDMDENVGNEANHNGVTIPSIDFGVNVLATQYTEEKDSFDNQYDANATYPGAGAATPNPTASGVNIPVFNTERYKIGAVEVPTKAMADPDAVTKVDFVESAYKGNFTVAVGSETKVIDIVFENLAEGNTTDVTVYVAMPKGLDKDTVKVYHYDEEIPCTYNYQTGLVKFASATFSPFTIEYDAESKHTPSDTTGTTRPTAIVTPFTETDNIEWGSYGQWSPNPNLEAELEAAYTFACPETYDEAYADWYCDFVVKLDRALGENQIFLGGNYGDFGWVGFHNGDLTLEANTEIPLLGSVTSHPWTYVDVVNYVGEFTCGVGDVDDALSGATFTVMLRLTNPENEAEFYDVNTIEYTFK